MELAPLLMDTPTYWMAISNNRLFFVKLRRHLLRVSSFWRHSVYVYTTSRISSCFVVFCSQYNRRDDSLTVELSCWWWIGDHCLLIYIYDLWVSQGVTCNVKRFIFLSWNFLYLTLVYTVSEKKHIPGLVDGRLWGSVKAGIWYAKSEQIFGQRCIGAPPGELYLNTVAENVNYLLPLPPLQSVIYLFGG